METDSVTLSQIITQLGMSGIFLYLFFLLWNESKKERELNKSERQLKDNRLQELTDTLIEKYSENTTVMSELKTAVEKNTKTIDDSTKSNDTLSDRIYDIIIPRRRNTINDFNSDK